MEKFKLSSPWTIFYRQVEALFIEDPAVTVIFDEEAVELKIYVEGATKAEAIEALLPSEKVFGNVTVKISVIPSNVGNMDRISLIQKAFEGNPALKEIISGELFTTPIHYVVFEKEVVQFFVDNLSDAHGVYSTLYQDLAKEIIGQDKGVFFCTDIEKD